MIRKSGNRFSEEIMLKQLNQLETIALGSRIFAKEVFHVKQRLPAAISTATSNRFILRETTPCKVARRAKAR
jgi:hypothetical protein